LEAWKVGRILPAFQPSSLPEDREFGSLEDGPYFTSLPVFQSSILPNVVYTATTSMACKQAAQAGEERGNFFDPVEVVIQYPHHIKVY
jgi:hypothetical protein